MLPPRLLKPVLAGLALSMAGCAHAQATPDLASASVQTPFTPISTLREIYGDEHSRYMHVRGVEVHYKDEGQGPVLLMIHGSQSTLKTYDRITELLQDRYRIIRMDLPGYGLSGAVSDEAAAASQPVQIIEGLVDALGIERLTAVGVSSGGTMAVYLAAKRPELVERLVLSNMPSGVYATDHLVMPEGFLAAQARFAQNGRYDLNFWEEYLRYFAGDPARMTDAKIAEYYAFNNRPPDPNQVALIARVGDGVEAQRQFAAVTAPALLIWGTLDALLPESAAVALQGYLGNSQTSRVLLPDVGHYPPLEVPDRFADIMAAYLESGVLSQATD
jgi:pimeloyl-ACP methyl ester carboxylesterase